MKALILAAGLGRRMLPLTRETPKPLLSVGGKPLLQYHLEALAKAGITEVIINLAHLGEQIRTFAGRGDAYGLRIRYSEEPEPLETGGAILHAQPLLGDEPFLLVNGDVWCPCDFARLTGTDLPEHCDGRLLLVPNPDFHPRGDFALLPDGQLSLNPALPHYTFAGISVLHPRLIENYPQKRRIFPLLEALKPAIIEGRLQGEVFPGAWSDVGTPERLQALEEQLAGAPTSP